jgi:hypothetical protein
MMQTGMTAAKLLPFLLASGGLAALHLLQRIVPRAATWAPRWLRPMWSRALACSLHSRCSRRASRWPRASPPCPGTRSALGAAIACCEIGVLLSFRAGWPVGTTGVSMSAVMTLILFPIGAIRGNGFSSCTSFSYVLLSNDSHRHLYKMRIT